MSTYFLNFVSVWMTPIAPNPSVNKAKKMSAYFLSLG